MTSTKRPLVDRVWDVLERLDRRLENQLNERTSDRPAAVRLVTAYHDEACAVEHAVRHYHRLSDALPDVQRLRRLLERHRRAVS